VKICPKCRGIYPDDLNLCDSCSIELFDKKSFYEIYYELLDMTEKQRRDHRYEDRYEVICKYQFNSDYNYEEFQAETEKMYERIKKNQIQQSVKPAVNIPKCPTCGSTNVKKITLLNRAVSIGMLGLLSGKIGKNYECKDCGSKW